MNKQLISSNKAGVALVIVLSLLVIIIMLVVAVVNIAISERRSSAAADATLNTGLLAGLVENLTQTQIRAATTQPASIAWASQPGMIRSFNTDGSLNTAYKLYSGQDRQLTSAAALNADFAADATISADYMNRPATYTDLNAPVILQDEVSYPIADPRALGKVDGFLYNSSTTAPTRSLLVNGTATDLPVIPMPVQWMYVLREGQIVAPARDGENNKKLAVPGATDANPIVGRIAYWADDDTCKLNVNTAADGTYWDTPRAGDFWAALPPFAGKWTELLYAVNQPARNEFQRFQGHPATTSLRPVLKDYLAATDPSPADPAALREALLGISPRYTTGGSLGGTVVPSLTQMLQPKTDRFFAEVDEYFLQPSRVAYAILDKETIEQTRFFLSAHSRAPETNLFNMPRVSLWPVSATASIDFRTVTDRLNLFCSTLGTTNANTYAFLRTVSSVNHGDLSGRNLTLYNYLNVLMSRPSPGFGPQTLAGKYGSDQPQLLTQIYDFIRSTNIMDQSMPNKIDFQPFTSALNGPSVGRVIPTENPSNDTRGFGRFYAISEIALSFVGQRRVEPGGTFYDARGVLDFELTSVAQGYGVFRPLSGIRVSGLGNFRVSPVVGGPDQPLFPADIAQMGPGSFGIGRPSREVPGGTLGLLSQFADMPPDGRLRFATNAFSFTAAPVAESGPGFNWDSFARINYFAVTQSAPITIEILNENSVVVQSYQVMFPPFQSRYPKPILAIGELWNVHADLADPLSLPALNLAAQTLAGRLTLHLMGGGFPCEHDIVKSLVPLGDATPIRGDLRLVAAMRNVPVEVFQPNINYSNRDALARVSHSFSYVLGAYGDPHNDGQFGFLVPGLSPTPTRGQAIPPEDFPPVLLTTGARNIQNKPGDFDTGISFMPAGAWINKPDDGDMFDIVASPGGQRPTYYRGDLTAAIGQTLFSSSRQVASSVQFGSLPTGVKAGRPWQTLVFSPNPAAVETNADRFSASAHRGFQLPRDHLLLDLFWMPVVEPYPISDPFSTAGKVNLNAQIVPFVGLERTSALRGVLSSVKITAIPQTQPNYKAGITAYAPRNNYRYPIDANRTVHEINRRFTQNEIYMSASEICDIFLIPSQDPDNPIATFNLDQDRIVPRFWARNRLTGDNLRERPYNAIYPRLTTKSNVFTVHYTVQALKKVTGGDPAVWDESRDKVVGEQRGAITIERYIDPRDPEFLLPAYDFAARVTDATPPTLGRFYKFRTVSTREVR